MQREDLLNKFYNCDFHNLTENNFFEKILDNLPEDFCYEYFHGRTKICIAPDNKRYVIKIPFGGDMSHDANWNQVFKRFNSANDSVDHEWDYCFTELIYYNYSKHEKLQDMFCKTRLLGYINDYPIYISEKATIFSEIYNDERDERSINTEKYCSEHYFECFNPIWIADAIEYYGQSRFNRLMSFIENYKIEDLHTENIGYIKKRPVLVDFSSFGS